MRSSDDKWFEVDQDVWNMFEDYKKIIDILNNDGEDVPVPYVKSKYLAKTVRFAEYILITQVPSIPKLHTRGEEEMIINFFYPYFEGESIHAMNSLWTAAEFLGFKYLSAVSTLILFEKIKRKKMKDIDDRSKLLYDMMRM